MFGLSRCPRCILHKIAKYNKCDRLFSVSASRQDLIPHTTRKGDVIHLPKRIERSPTDILDALASTIDRVSAPHYKYIDDPVASPASTRDKQAYSLAKAAGKKAAQFAVKKWPQNFIDNPMDPTIEVPEVFRPFTGPTSAEDTEEGLRERIELRLVKESSISYQKNKEAGNELSLEVLHDLLDLMCVYNSREPNEVVEEETVFKEPTALQVRSTTKNTWSNEGVAEMIFTDLKEPTNHAYCSLIRGLTKFNNFDKAIELYAEMKEKGMKPDLQTYNAMIATYGLAYKGGIDDRINMFLGIFREMTKVGIEPDIETFNTAMCGVMQVHWASVPTAATFCANLLTEMTSYCIEPTLATWYYILSIFYRDNNSRSPVLNQILDIIEERKLEGTHADDYKFFTMAMTKAAVNLQDLELVYRIDKLLNRNDHYRLLGDNINHNMYYRFFLTTLYKYEQIDTVMGHFHKIVPNWFVPVPPGILELVEALELNEGYEYIPGVWTVMFNIQYYRMPNIVGRICQLMAKKKHEDKLQTQFSDMVADFYDRMRYEVLMFEEAGTLDRNQNIRMLTAPQLGYICVICLHAGDAVKAREVFEFFLNFKNRLSGAMSQVALVKLVDMFIEEKDFLCSLEVLKLMSQNAYRATDETAERIKSLLQLSKEQKMMVDDLL